MSASKVGKTGNRTGGLERSGALLSKQEAAGPQEGRNWGQEKCAGRSQERAGDEELSRADGSQKTTTTVRPESETPLCVRLAAQSRQGAAFLVPTLGLTLLVTPGGQPRPRAVRQLGARVVRDVALQACAA